MTSDPPFVPTCALVPNVFTLFCPASKTLLSGRVVTGERPKRGRPIETLDESPFKDFERILALEPDTRPTANYAVQRILTSPNAKPSF